MFSFVKDKGNARFLQESWERGEAESQVPGGEARGGHAPQACSRGPAQPAELTLCAHVRLCLPLPLLLAHVITLHQSTMTAATRFKRLAAP